MNQHASRTPVLGHGAAQEPRRRVIENSVAEEPLAWWARIEILCHTIEESMPTAESLCFSRGIYTCSRGIYACSRGSMLQSRNLCLQSKNLCLYVKDLLLCRRSMSIVEIYVCSRESHDHSRESIPKSLRLGNFPEPHGSAARLQACWTQSVHANSITLLGVSECHGHELPAADSMLALVRSLTGLMWIRSSPAVTFRV